MTMELNISCWICGCHIYCNIWDVLIGEEVGLVREPLNEYDRCTVAVIKDDVIIGHLPLNISRVCLLFYANREVLYPQ